jgi:hypothetical protein
MMADLVRMPSDKDINGLEFLGMARPPLAEEMRK